MLRFDAASKSASVSHDDCIEHLAPCPRNSGLANVPCAPEHAELLTLDERNHINHSTRINENVRVTRLDR